MFDVFVRFFFFMLLFAVGVQVLAAIGYLPPQDPQRRWQAIMNGEYKYAKPTRARHVRGWNMN